MSGITKVYVSYPLKSALMVFDPFQDRRVDTIEEAVEISKQTGLKIHWKGCDCYLCKDRLTLRVA